MNHKFFELPEDKQLRVINAGLEVFSKNEYKRASTDEIARQAGVSKGLLFYYFHNKKELYLFLYNYTEQVIKQSVIDSDFKEITDFFELLDFATEKKYQLLIKNPHFMEFVMRAFYSQKENISDEMDKKMEDASTHIFAQYFSNINFSKFKEDVNPLDILQMVTWMVDGFLHEKQRTKTPVNFEKLMEKYVTWRDILKKSAYKEECLVE
ncbi:MAG: TetR/AcrR family transcriptional regulator [Turicibacter sp.]